MSRVFNLPKCLQWSFLAAVADSDQSWPIVYRTPGPCSKCRALSGCRASQTSRLPLETLDSRRFVVHQRHRHANHIRFVLGPTLLLTTSRCALLRRSTTQWMWRRESRGGSKHFVAIPFSVCFTTQFYYDDAACLSVLVACVLVRPPTMDGLSFIHKNQPKAREWNA